MLHTVDSEKQNRKSKDKHWLLISSIDRKDIHLAITMLAWIANNTCGKN
jgi:hypothetical protein